MTYAILFVSSHSENCQTFHSLKNASRFISSCACGLASFSTILCSSFWILGNSISPAIASTGRITGPEAVARLSSVLGSPQQFSDDLKDSTQDFVQDHFGTMAIAAAFGIAIRMRS